MVVASLQNAELAILSSVARSAKHTPMLLHLLHLPIFYDNEGVI